MKKSFFFSLFMFIGIFCSYGQRSFLNDSTVVIKDSIKIIYQKTEIESRKITKDSSGILLSESSLNRVLARSISYFMSGTNDFSFYKAYATFSNEDKRLSIFYNHPLKGDNQLLKGTIGGGFKGSIIDGVTSIYDGGTFNNDVGLFFNYTNLSESGKIHFDGNNKAKANARRKYIADVIGKSVDEKWEKFRKLNNDKNLLPSDLKEKFLKGLLDESLSEYYDNEIKQLSDFVNSCQSWWWGLNAYLQLGQTKYAFTNALNKNTVPTIKEHEFKNWDIKANINYFKDKKRLPFLLRAELVIANYNNILVYDNYSPKDLSLEKFSNTSKSQSYTFSDTTSTKGRVLKQTVSKDGKKSDLYVGQFETFTKITVNPYILLPFKNGTYLKGVRIFGNFDLQKEWKNTSAGFAIPLSFQGKEDKKVNFELVTTFKDLSNSFGTYTKISDRVNVGINLGLPLSNFFFD